MGRGGVVIFDNKKLAIIHAIMIAGRCLRSGALRIVARTMKAPVVLPDGARTLVVT